MGVHRWAARGQACSVWAPVQGSLLFLGRPALPHPSIYFHKLLTEKSDLQEETRGRALSDLATAGALAAAAYCSPSVFPTCHLTSHLASRHPFLPAPRRRIPPTRPAPTWASPPPHTASRSCPPACAPRPQSPRRAAARSPLRAGALAGEGQAAQFGRPCRDAAAPARATRFCK